ncbi:phosphatase 2C-like domain-containing protein [Crassisporium funariophilum]|nr:phosphatase 2C-like domain-containing protein [Crassisporium funariophilum]
MDAKLKALKVVDLKQILSSAKLSAPAKATKTDLIARIQASKEALAAYAALHPQQDDLLAPPEAVDWNDDQPEATVAAPPPPSPPKPVKPPAAAAAAAAPKPTPVATTTDTTVDAEAEMRRKRAERFGIPVVEPKSKAKRVVEPAKKDPAPSSDDQEKLKRAARFGTKPTPDTTAPVKKTLKRPAPPQEQVDPEELERRKKRAERFGISTKTTDMGWPQIDALWKYTVLPEPVLTTELARLSLAKSVGDTDVVTFQPCPNPEHFNQDRFVISDWELPNGTWAFRAIFDGHAGHETADYAAAALPDSIKEALLQLIEGNSTPTPSTISDLLTKTISSFDHNIGQGLLSLFPDPEALAKLSNEEIQAVVNDGGPNSAAVLRCMRGSTVLVSLTDPSRTNIWVASLGDCAAVLGTKDASGQWSAQVLSSSHNGENEVEANKVRREHPGEPECMLDDRVLGAIAVTRAVGDFSFKLPAVYTERVFLNSSPGFVAPEKVRSFIGRNITPPYMSAIPDVQHVELAPQGESFLIMCTDGMMDLDEVERLKVHEVLSKRWVQLIGAQYGEKSNLALSLLRDGLGGKNEDKVSRMITVEMFFRWMDDTTITVQRL